MAVVTKPIDELVPADYNPRVELRPGDKDYEALARSVAEFGLVEPLVWNRRTGRLVGGHQRLTVLRNAGITDVPVVEIDVDETQERQLNVALNKVAGRWDDPRLAELLADLEQSDDGEALLELTGFTDWDVEDVLRRVDSQNAAEVLAAMTDKPAEPKNPDDPQELTPKERRRLEGDQTVERNWFNIGYAVTEEGRDLITDALKVIRRRYDHATPSESLVWLCAWWLEEHSVHNDPEDDES